MSEALKVFMLFALIELPFITGIGSAFIKNKKARSYTVILSSAIVCFAAVLLYSSLPFTFSYEDMPLYESMGMNGDMIFKIANSALLLFILYLVFYSKSFLGILFVLIQIAIFIYLEHFIIDTPFAGTFIHCDMLSAFMAVLGSVSVSAAAIYSLPKAEKKWHFLPILAIAGALNGFALTNNLLHMFFFSQLAFVCLLFLTSESIKNISKHLLWTGCFSGAFFLLAVLWIYNGGTNSLDIQKISTIVSERGILILPIAALSIAGFARSGIFPFGRWLLETSEKPVFVHMISNTVVASIIGIYPLVRFSKGFPSSFLGMGLGVYGAFILVAGILLASSAKNASKAMTYFSIALTGTAFSFTGINSPAAHTIALAILIMQTCFIIIACSCIDAAGIKEKTSIPAKIKSFPISSFIMEYSIVFMLTGIIAIPCFVYRTAGFTITNPLASIILLTGTLLVLKQWSAKAAELFKKHNEEKTVEKNDAYKQGIQFIASFSFIVLCIALPFIIGRYINFFAEAKELPFYPVKITETAIASTIIFGIALLSKPVYRLLQKFECPLCKSNQDRCIRKKLCGAISNKYENLTANNENSIYSQMNVSALVILAFIFGGMVHFVYILGGHL